MLFVAIGLGIAAFKVVNDSWFLTILDVLGCVGVFIVWLLQACDWCREQPKGRPGPDWSQLPPSRCCLPGSHPGFDEQPRLTNEELNRSVHLTEAEMEKILNPKRT